MRFNICEQSEGAEGIVAERREAPSGNRRQRHKILKKGRRDFG